MYCKDNLLMKNSSYKKTTTIRYITYFIFVDAFTRHECRYKREMTGEKYVVGITQGCHPRLWPLPGDFPRGGEVGEPAGLVLQHLQSTDSQHFLITGAQPRQQLGPVDRCED